MIGNMLKKKYMLFLSNAGDSIKQMCHILRQLARESKYNDLTVRPAGPTAAQCASMCWCEVSRDFGIRFFCWQIETKSHDLHPEDCSEQKTTSQYSLPIMIIASNVGLRSIHFQGLKMLN